MCSKCVSAMLRSDLTPASIYVHVPHHSEYKRYVTRVTKLKSGLKAAQNKTNRGAVAELESKGGRKEGEGERTEGMCWSSTQSVNKAV